jgi:hypothetical protein
MKHLCLALFMCLLISLLPTHKAQAITFTPTLTQTVKVIIHLLDANNQPLAGVTINLLLNRYGDTIEEIHAGSCVTDATGSCSITVDDPPRLRSGRIEGFINLGTYGRQLIGWKGDTFEITLQLYPDGKLATVPAPLDAPYEGQTEQPTDAPLTTSTSTPRATATPKATVTRLSSTITPAHPTFTSITTATATFTPQADFPTISVSPTPEPSLQAQQQSGWAWIGLGFVLFAVLIVAFAIYYHRQHKPRQSG